VFLVVEVADTSVEEDRTLKLPRYAASDIAEVWLVDINQRKIEVYHTPVGAGADAGYKVRVEYREGETLSPSAFPNVKLGVAGILPKAEVLS
jgi:Uma2 family endonuclease